MQTFRPLTRRRRIFVMSSVFTIAMLSLIPWKLTAQEQRSEQESGLQTKERSYEPVTSDNANSQSGRMIEIYVVDQAGQPVERAEVIRNHVFKPTDVPSGGEIKKIENDHYQTDAEGRAVASLSGTTVDLRLWVRKEKLVPLHAMWAKQRQSDGDKIPNRFTFQLKPGNVIGGTVTDESGNPIEGVSVEVVDLTFDRRRQPNKPGVRPIRDRWLAYGDTAVYTDDEGHWRLDNVPWEVPPSNPRRLASTVKFYPTGAERARFFKSPRLKYDPNIDIGAEIDSPAISLRFSHPDYANDSEWGELQQEQGVTLDSLWNQTASIAMSRGNTLSGRITDPDGHPIRNALVVIRSFGPSRNGTPRHVRTDADGWYEFEHLSGRRRSLAVVAEGWPLEFESARVDRETRADFQLRPAKKIKVKFIDGEGVPIPNVHVSLVLSDRSIVRDLQFNQEFQAEIPSYSDEAGRWTWTAAADDRLRFNFSREGYQTVEHYTLTPANGVYTVTLINETEDQP